MCCGSRTLLITDEVSCSKLLWSTLQCQRLWHGALEVTLLSTWERSCEGRHLTTLVQVQIVLDGVKFTPAAMRAVGIADTGLVMRHVLLAALCFHSYQQVPELPLVFIVIHFPDLISTSSTHSCHWLSLACANILAPAGSNTLTGTPLLRRCRT